MVDNRAAYLAPELRKILPKSNRVRIATGYFYASGFQRIAEATRHLQEEESVRVILGAETDRPTKYALEHGAEDRKAEIIRNIKEELFGLDDDPSSADYLQELYEAVRTGRFRFRVYKDGTFHPKCYLFDSTELTDYAYVGSSNLTGPGISENLELNVLVKDELAIKELRRWFDALFEDDDLTEDLREDILEVVESTPIIKRRNTPEFVTPWEMILAVGHEFLRHRPVEDTGFLAEFQKTGVFSALKKIEDYGGCIVADSVGLGKSFIGGEVLKNFHNSEKPDGEPYRVLALVPAHLQDQWISLLRDDGPPGRPDQRYFGMEIDGDFVEVESQGVFSLMNETEALEAYGNYDVILVDEAHRFRNDPHEVKRVRNLLALKNNPQRAEADAPKFVFLTATPLNNSVKDLKNLINLCTISKRLESREGMRLEAFDTFLKYLRKEEREGPDVALTDPQRKEKQRARKTIERILKEVMILRTRDFLQNRPGGIVVGGRRLEFSRPIVRTEQYDQPSDKFRQLVNYLPDFLDEIEAPHITIVNPEAGSILTGLYRVHLLKRLESSVYAFWKSLENFQQSLNDLEGKLNDEGKSFQEIVDELAGIPASQRYTEEGMEDIQAADEAQRVGDDEEREEAERERFLQFIEDDRELIRDLIETYFDSTDGLRNPEGGTYAFEDAKVPTLIKQISRSSEDKALVFTQYADTAKYLRHHMAKWVAGQDEDYRLQVGMSTGTESWHPNYGTSTTRRDMVWYFSPKANERKTSDDEVLHPDKDEIDVLIATDSLSEGANLQDCHFLVNYDLPWNPTRIVQRVGRIDRIVREGQPGQNEVVNLISPDVVEANLGLLETLERKGSQIAMFVAKEYGLLSSDEEIAIRTYGHDVESADVAMLRDRINRLQTAGADELEKIGRNPFLKEAIQEDEKALWRLSLRELLDQHNVSGEHMAKAREKFPDDELRYALFRGKDPGIFLYGQVQDFKRDRVHDDLLLWHDLRTGELYEVDPGNLGIDPAMAGFSWEEVEKDKYEDPIDQVLEAAEARLHKHKDDAEGLTTTVQKQHPKTQRKLVIRLKQLRTADERAQRGRGIQEDSPLPEDIRQTFIDSFNWFAKNTLTRSDDKQLRERLPDDWHKLDPRELHDIIHPFHLEKKKERQDYRVGTVGPEDLTLRLICGGVSIGQRHEE